MRVKFIMSWDVVKEQEREYYEFIVNEYIPSLNKLGMTHLEFWYTMYGNEKQMVSSGITQNLVTMTQIQQSDEWNELMTKLETYTADELTLKVIPANNSFQL